MTFKTEIWKLQRPLATNDPEPKVLMYNQDRSKMGEFPITPEIAQLFMDDEYKIFVLGTINEEGEVNFEGPAEWQDW